MYFLKELSCSTDGSIGNCIRFIFDIDSDFWWGVFCCIIFLIFISISIIVILYIFKWLEPIFDMRREYIKKQENKLKNNKKRSN